MKHLKTLTAIIAIVIFISSNLIAQNFSAIDEHSKKAPSAATKSVEKLAEYLNENTTNDLEKVRAYYTHYI